MPKALNSALRARRTLALILFDGLTWTAGIGFAALMRLDFRGEAVNWARVSILVAVMFAAFVVVGRAVHLHHGAATVATVDETVLLSVTTLAAGGFVSVINLFVVFVPRSVPPLGAIAALGLMLVGRALWRTMMLADARKSALDRGERVVIIGAGDASRQVVNSMLKTPTSPWVPVALLDDDPRKCHLKILGVPVRGVIDDLPRIAEEYDVASVVVAVPSAERELFQRVAAAARPLSLDVKVLPGVGELLQGRAGIRDIRDINVDDLLGRKQVDTDLGSIADYLSGKRVLVTGAGGSIGSELCRQIHRFGPSQLLMLDRDESALHSVQLSIYGHGMLNTPDMLLCDIRDAASLDELFETRRPEVVFHAAALKHLPMLEQYPVEGFKTNVIGTLNVLTAAQRVDVGKFINISTDKAANPTSVLGYTKRIAEGLTAQVAEDTEGTYLSVRFGNVLGSRGSVLETFASQIAAGGPITVTHPDVTRFFMTIPEAVQLVIQAGAIGDDGEALVLDMGEPIKIDFVAKQLIAQGHHHIEIEYTGMRVGEKLHEDLVGIEERTARTKHPLISHVRVPALRRDIVGGLCADRTQLRERLSAICADMATLSRDSHA